MFENFIGIDASLKATGLVINDDILNIYCPHDVCLNKKGLYNKWFEICGDYIQVKLTKFQVMDNFTESEFQKISDYTNIVDLIITDIKSSGINLIKTLVCIEGYSYSSNSGPLIDLVTFGTILRKELSLICPNIKIIPPSQVKQLAGKLTYPFTPKNKKGTVGQYINNEGIPSGNFKKNDMYKVLIENEKLQTKYVNFLRQIQTDVFQKNSIPKPIEDINDAYIIKEIGRNNLI